MSYFIIMRLIHGKNTIQSNVGMIWKMISNLTEQNKATCLKMIMELEADDRQIFLNPYMAAVNLLPTTPEPCPLSLES